MSDLPRTLLCSFDVIPGPTGSSRRLSEYVKGLSDRFQVVVLSAKTPDTSHIERFHGARLLRVPVGSGDLASRLQAFDRAVRRQLVSEEYALAHFTDPYGGYALCEQKSELGFRLVYDAQSFPSQELRYTHPQTEGDRRFLSKVRRQELYCLMNADRVITGSSVTRQFIRGLGVASEAVRVLRSPVELEPYRPEVLGKPDGAPMRVLYLGSQLGYQGLPTLLRAVQLAARQTDLRLTLIGPRHPEWQAHLEDLVEELKLSGKVEFQPPVPHDDLHKVVASCDVGVVPLDTVERNELQGGALAKTAEYFAGGRPVVAADLPVTRELLPDSATLFYRAGDFKMLADRLLELASDPARRVALGARAREEAERTVDAALVRGQLIDLYDELLGRRSAPARTGEEDSGRDTQIGTPTMRVQSGAAREQEEHKTDPAIRAEGVVHLPDGEPPIVVGTKIEEDSGPTPAPTEPDLRPEAEPPVVMGTPLREPTTDLHPADETVPIPILTPPSGAADPPAPHTMNPTQPLPPPSQAEEGEPEEISSEDIVDVEEPAPIASRMDPWFAQLAHGYCPPDGARLARPPPPAQVLLDASMK